MDQKQRPRRTVRREVKRSKCLEKHGVLTICPLEVTGDLDGPPAGAEFKEATRELGSQWPVTNAGYSQTLSRSQAVKGKEGAGQELRRKLAP